ncbi:hypothetical protein M3N64_06245 [Sporolactobacillus sp. CPB3-1]|uniref:Polysaccharide chain length determinant N-terminal domain-containing protein n=1 Tax=Sporolactobacillus mangiferae TaxID=2940498 RepID=A0ABT0M9J7_9BACL|nr:hypothetical protein [Sporolactobacillus mangiferae]MCL1631548.1 hypothetical protein [Sporolactobacillus mangiferae]
MKIFNSVAARMKKYWWIVVALPVLLGIIGWLVPAGKMPSSYEAQTTIQLGTYDDSVYNDPNQVLILLTNASFYEQQLPDLWNDQEQELLSRIGVTDLSNHLIQISYRGKSAEDAIMQVNKVADAFLAADQQRFEQKKKILDQAIQSMKTARAADGEVSRIRYLYKLQSEKLELSQAKILEPAQKGTGTSVSAFSPKKRAALGFMIGVTLVVVGMVLPEFVRRKS